MKICLATRDSADTVWQEKFDKIEKPDVIVFGYNGLGLISYKKELSGETEYFQDLARLSKTAGAVVISGCDTDTYGVFRHSAVIADKGRLLGVSDSVYSIDDGEFVPGGNLKVYDTSAGKIGICVAEDLYFPQVFESLSLFDADLIVCVFKQENETMNFMFRAGAFVGGLDCVLVAKGYGCVADAKGKVSVSGRDNFVKAEIMPTREYKKISTKKRGYGKSPESAY